MMGKYTGIKIQVYIAKLTEKEKPILIGGQRDATLNLDLSEIDTSSKDDEDGWEEVIGGQRGWNIALNGAHVTDDEAYEMLEDGILQKNHNPEIGLFWAYMKMPSGKSYAGKILITNLGKTAPYQDLVTYSCTFKGVGPLIKEEMPEFVTPTSTSTTPTSTTSTKTAKEDK